MITTEQFNTIKEYLTKYTLDPIILNYSGGLYPIKSYRYMPEADQEFKDKVKQWEEAGNYALFLRFQEITIPFHSEQCTKEQGKELKKLVEDHFKTDRFQKEFNKAFNCMCAKLTIYFNQTLNRWSGNWWIDDYSKAINIVSIESNEFKKLANSFEVTLETPNIVSTEINPCYKLIHFTDEEYKYIYDNLKKYGGVDMGIYLRQSYRQIEKTEEMEGWPEFTFEPTGRKIKYDPKSIYGLHYLELSPVKFV